MSEKYDYGIMIDTRQVPDETLDTMIDRRKASMRERAERNGHDLGPIEETNLTDSGPFIKYRLTAIGTPKAS